MKFIAEKIPYEELKLISMTDLFLPELNEKQCDVEFTKYEIPMNEREVKTTDESKTKLIMTTNQKLKY